MYLPCSPGDALSIPTLLCTLSVLAFWILLTETPTPHLLCGSGSIQPIRDSIQDLGLGGERSWVDIRINISTAFSFFILHQFFLSFIIVQPAFFTTVSSSASASLMHTPFLMRRWWFWLMAHSSILSDGENYHSQDRYLLSMNYLFLHMSYSHLSTRSMQGCFNFYK